MQQKTKIFYRESEPFEVMKKNGDQNGYDKKVYIHGNAYEG